MPNSIDPDDAAASLDPKIQQVRRSIRRIAENFSPAAFASSFGAEDMVLADIILAAGAPIEIFSLDTGRLFPETYDLIDRTRARYGNKIKLYFPLHSLIEPYLRDRGINAFYESAELRKTCCFIRKIEPLQRALSGKKAWITGLRAEQSPTRQALLFESFDDDNGLWKFNPLIDWTDGEIWRYIKQNRVPYNALHDRSYPSIGCAPCTRRVAPGGDPRSGRWWWEHAENRECGLHVKRVNQNTNP